MKKNLPISFNNYEDCLIGVAESFDNVVYIYDKEKILEKIMNVSGANYRDALAFYEINLKKNFGDRSPVFLTKINNLINVV